MTVYYIDPICRVKIAEHAEGADAPEASYPDTIRVVAGSLPDQITTEYIETLSNSGNAPMIDQVRAETLHRLCVAFAARDQEHLTIKVQDATIQAGVLTDKMARGEALTAEEQGLAAHLRQATALYMAIKATGNQFEALATTNTIPANWRSDESWPSSGGM